MRWFPSQAPQGPTAGDTRIITRFLWWPLSLKQVKVSSSDTEYERKDKASKSVFGPDKEQVRWLERATIYQEYRSRCRWRNVCFVDEE